MLPMSLELPNAAPNVEGIMENVIKPISNDSMLIGIAVDRLAYNITYGSFSDRNPVLGKMILCPACHRRRRVNSEIPCCSADYSKIALDKKGKECLLPHTKKLTHPHS